MLGIGANSAIFSAVDAVLLKPLPYPDAGRLVAVYELNMARAGATQLVAPGRLEDWNRLNRSFDGLAASYFENMTDTTGALPERVEAMRTSPRFFSVLGVAPRLGRAPAPQEEVFGGPQVAVVSDSFWRRRLDADPSAIGRPLVLGGASHTHRRCDAGVVPLPDRYDGDLGAHAGVCRLLLQARRARFYTAVGRLKPGVTIDQGRQDLDAVQARLGEQFPDTDKGWGASLVPLKEQQVAGVRRSLVVPARAPSRCPARRLRERRLPAARRRGARAITRSPIRFALGADRRRVIAQLLREGLLLACAGTALGLIVANWGVTALRTAATTLPSAATVHVDVRLVLLPRWSLA